MPVGHGTLSAPGHPVSYKKERSLILNGAGAGSGQTNLIALMEDETVIASVTMAGRGASEHFAPTVHSLLGQVAWRTGPDQVIAVVGPGSFTGLRATLSLAAGLARGWGCPAKGVRLGDALRETALVPQAVCVCQARRGRVFIDPPEAEVQSYPLKDLHTECWPIVLGDAVFGDDALDECIGREGVFINPAVQILPCAAPDAAGIYRASLRGKSLPLQPLYIDPPEARLPAKGIRPAPL